jgi:hypothetical protein
VEHADDRLGGLLGGHPLHGQGDDLAGALLALLAGLALDLPDDQRGLALRLVLDGHHQLGLRLVGGQPGDPLQDLAALLLDLVELRAPVGQLGLGLGELPAPVGLPAGLLVEPLLPLGEAVLPALEVGPELLQLVLEAPGLLLDLLAHPQRAFRGGLCPAQHLAGLGLRLDADLHTLAACVLQLGVDVGDLLRRRPSLGGTVTAGAAYQHNKDSRDECQQDNGYRQHDHDCRIHARPPLLAS